MKIGLFVASVRVREGYENNVSGHIQIALKTCELISGGGHDVHVITTDTLGCTELPHCMPKNVCLHVVDDGRKRGKFAWDSNRTGYKLLGLFRQLSQIKRLVKDLELDVLHLFGFERTLALGGVLGVMNLGAPVLVTLYGPVVSKRWNFLYRKVDAIVTATDFVRDSADELDLMPLLVRHGSVKKFSTRNSSVRNRVLFWREATHKAGADICAELFRRLANEYPAIYFDFAVRTNKFEIGGLEELAGDFRNVNIYRFPYTEGVTLDNLLNETICTIMPFRVLSIYPQLSVLESMSAGAVVVTSGIGCLPELVEHEKEGLIVSSESIEDYEYAVRRILDDEGQSDCFREKAYESIDQKWTWVNYLKQIEVIYRSVVH